MLNTHIGPYQIIREIGQDSIGRSFEVLHETRNKKVTLKYLRPETVTPEILPRLYSQARILALLNHPQIARVFGIVCRDDHLYLVTEFLQGETLETILKTQGRMQPAIALALFHQMMAGVAFAHRLGVMHGDLKPSNVLVTDADPPVKLLNFALAHLLGSNPVGSPDKDSRYVAPEQIEGDPPDARSDIYSLGMILYELIVGKRPFDVYGQSEDPVSKAQGQFIPVLPSLIVPDLPKWLDEFLLRMLAISPSDRFQSVRAMARVLEVETAHATKIASPERQGLSRQHWTDSIAFSKNRVVVAGTWSFDPIKTAILEVAKFPVRPARMVANRARAWAECAFMTLEPASHRISSASNYFLQAPKPLLESFKKRLSERVKADWRRYAQVTSLVVLILVESFYFHGANISSLIDTRLLSGPSLNDAVDSMFARINQEASKADHRETSKKKLATVVEPQDPSRQLVQNPAIPAPARVRSEPSQRLSDNRSHASPSIAAANSQKETNVPLPDVPNVKERDDTGPARTAQNTTPKSELNVKWEN